MKEQGRGSLDRPRQNAKTHWEPARSLQLRPTRQVSHLHSWPDDGGTNVHGHVLGAGAPPTRALEASDEAPVKEAAELPGAAGRFLLQLLSPCWAGSHSDWRLPHSPTQTCLSSRQTGPAAVSRGPTPGQESTVSKLSSCFSLRKQYFPISPSVFQLQVCTQKLLLTLPLTLLTLTLTSVFPLSFEKQTWWLFSSSTTRSFTAFWDDVDLLQGTAGKGFLPERVTLWDLIFGDGIQVSVHPKGTLSLLLLLLALLLLLLLLVWLVLLVLLLL